MKQIKKIKEVTTPTRLSGKTKNWYEIQQCPECGGEGYVYGSYDAITDGKNYHIMGACPICEGSGTIKKQ